MEQLKQKDVKHLRETLLQEQDGLCAICKKVIDDDSCLDHHHKKRIKGTGQIRGVLCRSCNVFLGKIENNAPRYGISQDMLPSMLLSIVDYLNRPHLPYIHPSEKPKKPKLSKRCFNTLSKAYTLDKPKNKTLRYPKSGNITKHLKKMFKKYQIEIIYNKT